MADAPWRCSQCGTVNEPVANACRTCGRWPSLFDLESNTIESESSSVTYDDADEYAAQTVEVEPFAPQAEQPSGEVSPEPLPETYGEIDVDEQDAEPSKPIWQRMASLIVPIGIVVYIIVSALLNNDAG